MRFIIPIAVFAGFVLLLHIQFPYVLDNPDNLLALTTKAILVLAFGATLFASGRASGTLKQLGIWAVIIMLLLVGYSYRDAILGSRVMAELMPSKAIARSDGALVVRAGENGHFFIDGMVNGAKVRFMVDTGASDIVLSPSDAKRAGYAPGKLQFDRIYRTANGIGKGAEVTLKSLEIGSLLVHDISASVNGAQMDGSLLGMTFLRLFKEYRVEDGSLILTP